MISCQNNRDMFISYDR